MCSLTAAGVGLNLQAASNVVLAELSWTDAEQTQAIDRVHRIGQELPVTAWRIIAAQTIDTKIAELIASKAGLAARALDGSDAEVAAEGSVQVEALVSLLTEALSWRPCHSELVVVSSESWPGRLDRDDIVVRKGMYTLINGHLTPHESMVEDLLAVRDVLETADIAFLLVRGDNDRPVLAVDRGRRKEIERGLRRRVRQRAVLRQAARRSRRPAGAARRGRAGGGKKASVFRLYRPRIEPIGRLRYGASTAVQLELWSFGDDVIQSPPAERADAARRCRAAKRSTDEVDLHGRRLADPARHVRAARERRRPSTSTWSSPGSTARPPSSSERGPSAWPSYVVGDGDDSEARFRQIDELKYALRSVYMYAPWVRRIFIATDSPAPTWLAKHPRVTVVPSERVLPEPAMPCRPTTRTRSRASCTTSRASPSTSCTRTTTCSSAGRSARSMFFSPGGVTKFIEATTRIGLGDNDPSRSGFENAARVNRRLLRERFGRITTRHLEHCGHAAAASSVLVELEREFPEDFARTAASPFRSATDISVTNSFYHYYALMTGRAVVQPSATVLLRRDHAEAVAAGR